MYQKIFIPLWGYGINPGNSIRAVADQLQEHIPDFRFPTAQLPPIPHLRVHGIIIIIFIIIIWQHHCIKVFGTFRILIFSGLLMRM